MTDIPEQHGLHAGTPDAAAAPDPGSSRLPLVLRALRHRNFRLFYGGQVVSLVGTWMQIVAQSWLVYRLTGSSALLGLVGFVSQIPVLLLAPVGGIAADRFPRHRVVVATQIASMLLAFILAFLTLGGHVRVSHILLLAGLLGVVNAVDIPARQSFIVEMVGKRDLMNAISLNSSMVHGARMVGPAVAGALVAAVGEGWCFMLNAASYLAVLAVLMMMRLPAPEHPAARGQKADVMDGFRFAWQARPVRALLLLVGLASLAGMPYATLMPVFSKSILGAGAGGLGLLMGAAGLGAFSGAIWLASRKAVHALGRWVGLGLAGFGACIILFALSRHFWLSVAVLVPAGFCMVLTMSASNTLIQAMVPNRLRGRVMAVYSMMFMGVVPIGSLIAGVLAEPRHLGPPFTVGLGGAACIAGAALFSLRMTDFRRELHAHITAAEAVSPAGMSV
jgi:MFS family permease